MEDSGPSTVGGGGSSSNNTSNPPSIELAYKKKCIQLKKRLNEIEAENDLIRARNKRAKVYVAKMRLETCIMLERLATVTGMLDEATAAGAGGGGGGEGSKLISSDLRAKAAAIVQSAHAQSNQDVMDDETEGSSEDQPPTPQERPLRVKRSRKSNIAFEEIEAEAAMQYEAEESPDNNSNNNNNLNDSNEHNTNATSPHLSKTAADKETSSSTTLPSLAPATAGQGEERRSSGFRAVNKLDSANDGHVPMDVDEKPSKSED